MDPTILKIAFSETSSAPLYKQLGQALLNAVEAGTLSTGQIVPSTYTLCTQYGVSRATAVRCYEFLKQQGLLVADRGGRTRINPGWQDARASMNFEPPGAEDEEATSEDFGAKAPSVLQEPDAAWRPYCIDPLRFPNKVWSRMHNRLLVSEAVREDLRRHSDELGYLPLRKSLSAMLFRTRGIVCDHRNLVVFQGAQQAYACLTDLVSPEVGTVCLANQGYDLARSVYEQRRLTITADSSATLLHISPCNQLPLGTELTPPERSAVLQRLSAGALLLEDESRGVFHCGKAPTISLCAVAPKERSIYLGSLAPVVSPLSELAFAIVPSNFLPRLRSLRSGAHWQPPLIEHKLLGPFIEGGHYDLTLQKQRTELSRSRQLMVAALGKTFGQSAQVIGGLNSHVLPVKFLFEVDHDRIMAAAFMAGLELRLLDGSDAALRGPRFANETPFGAPVGGTRCLIRYVQPPLSADTAFAVFRAKLQPSWNEAPQVPRFQECPTIHSN